MRSSKIIVNTKSKRRHRPACSRPEGEKRDEEDAYFEDNVSEEIAVNHE